MKTYSPKPADIVRKWYVLDASEAPMGRTATRAASLLLGKGKASVASHMDMGDYVIIINASKLVTTGNKLGSKTYYRHSGYPGGLRKASLSQVMDRDPLKPLHMAIRGMLPVNKLRSERLKRLKIYADENHNHNAQNPKTLSLKQGAK